MPLLTMWPTRHTCRKHTVEHHQLQILTTYLNNSSSSSSKAVIFRTNTVTTKKIPPEKFISRSFYLLVALACHHNPNTIHNS